MNKFEINARREINEVIRETVTAFFDYIRPSILMIGPWDDYFTNIKTQYKWADHVLSPPNNLKNTSLVIVNNRHYFNQIVLMLKSSTSVIVYDESEVVPVEERIRCHNRVCYLKSSSPRHINGHVRSMLQLQRWFLQDTEKLPLIVSDRRLLQKLQAIVTVMDRGLPINITTSNPYYFFLLFKALVKNTPYQHVRFIDNVNSFDELASHKYTTLILKVNSLNEYRHYLKKALMEYSIVFISSFDIKSEETYEAISLPELAKSKSAFFLTAYYYSLQQNLKDENNRTRFVQTGDLNKLYNKAENILDFYDKLRLCYKKNTLRFKNKSPMISGASYGRYPLGDLIEHLEGEIYRDVLEQTDYGLDYAVMVSNVKRSVLKQHKLKTNSASNRRKVT